MSEGFLAFKWIGWSAAGLLALAAVAPDTTTAQWNAMKSTMQSRPGLLKKNKGGGGTTSTTTGTTTGTTSGGSTTTTTTTSIFGYPQETTINSEFAASTTIFASYMPASQPAGEGVGAFRFMCGAGQLKRDDPLLYPGRPGAAHLHQFYGNMSANANSTFASLRTSGVSTCGSPNANAANRSAYWMPALLDGKGNVVQPDTVDLYYKRWPKTSTDCTSGKRAVACVGIPNGLRFVWGYDMPTGKAAQYPFGFYCETVAGEYNTMAQALAGGRCPVGSHLYVRSDAPSCWDGKNLDSADHRSHVAYMEDTHLGYMACPSTHPIHVPALTLSVGYRIAAGDDTSKWRFSSDEMHPELPSGSTMHADYWEAWDPTVKSMWEANCIDKFLNCVGGALGNGYSIIGAQQPWYGWTNPNHLVPIPN